MFFQLPWATNELSSWPKRKKPKKRKAIPSDDQGMTLQSSSQTDDTHISAVSTDPEASQDQAPEDKPNTAPAAPAAAAAPAASINTVVPILLKEGPSDARKPVADNIETIEKPQIGESPSEATAPEQPCESKPTAPSVFKNWADVARGSAAAKSAAGAQPSVNGTAANTGAGSAAQTSGATGVAQQHARALGEVLQSYNVDVPDKIAFLEPRGLYNSAVDCYINSVSFFIESDDGQLLNLARVKGPSSPALLPPVL